jgi:nucleotide-binding universal stress UspA family protein
MKHILVPTDFSETTGLIMQTLDAWDVKGKVFLLHVLPFDAALVGDDVEPLDMPCEKQPQKHRLEQLAQRVRAAGHQVETQLLMGSTVETILDQVERCNIDLVVMGSHDHGALYDLIVGSTSEGVLRKATCPVLIVPSHARQTKEVPHAHPE